MPQVTEIKLSQIQMAREAQPRVSVDIGSAAEYGEALQAGVKFPPVVVFGTNGNYWLADGWHRMAADEAIYCKTIRAQVRKGGLRDAVLYSCGANATPGLRRTNANKRRAVMKLVKDEEWPQWSNREIARRAAVHHTFVDKLRNENICR